MKTARFEVLNRQEVERIHAASMDVLETVGIKVDYKVARDLFQGAGAKVDHENQQVCISEDTVRWPIV